MDDTQFANTLCGEACSVALAGRSNGSHGLVDAAAAAGGAGAAETAGGRRAAGARGGRGAGAIRPAAATGSRRADVRRVSRRRGAGRAVGVWLRRERACGITEGPSLVPAR